MKRGKRQIPRQRRGGKTEEERTDRNLTKPDPLMKEVEEDNARISNPDERERVIPSKPC